MSCLPGPRNAATARRRISDDPQPRSRGSQLAVKRIVLQRAAHDEWPPVRQHDHAVTEHVPGHRLSADGIGLRIPDGGLVICVAGNVSRAGDHQYLARVQQRDVHGIDRHGIGQGCPLPLYVWLSHGRGGQKKKCYKSEGEDSPRAHSKSVFHETPRVTEVVLWQLGTNNQGEVYAKSKWPLGALSTPKNMARLYRGAGVLSRCSALHTGRTEMQPAQAVAKLEN